MRPADVHRLSVDEAADRYIDMVRAKTVTGALAPGTAEVYSRDVRTFAALAGGERVLDDLSGADVDEVLLRFAAKPDGRRAGARAGGVVVLCGVLLARFWWLVLVFFWF